MLLSGSSLEQDQAHRSLSLELWSPKDWMSGVDVLLFRPLDKVNSCRILWQSAWSSEVGTPNPATDGNTPFEAKLTVI